MRKTVTLDRGSTMRVKIHARGIEDTLRVALSAMTDHIMKQLVPSKKLRNFISIDIRLKHHDQFGEAILVDPDGAGRYRARVFDIILDHHRMKEDDYGRVRGDTEWCHEILKTLGHELVHVKQYVTGELNWREAGLTYKGAHYDPGNLLEYFELPYEIEAYGRERGLLVSFLVYWANIEKELGLDDG